MSQPSTAGKTAGRFVTGERILVAAHEQPGPFFKALLTHLDREDRRQLNARLARAERDQRCLHRAVFLMAVLLMISVAGLGYCALLLPEVFRNPTHLLMRGLTVLGLGSLISQVVFLTYLLWHRATVTHLHGECRRLILALAHTQLTTPGRPEPGLPIPVGVPIPGTATHPAA